MLASQTRTSRRLGHFLGHAGADHLIAVEVDDFPPLLLRKHPSAQRVVVTQCRAAVAPIGHQYLYERPESSRVIVLDGVAQFVDNNIIGKLRWQMHQPPVEVQIAETRTASPDAAVIFYTHPTHRK